MCPKGICSPIVRPSSYPASSQFEMRPWKKERNVRKKGRKNYDLVMVLLIGVWDHEFSSYVVVPWSFFSLFVYVCFHPSLPLPPALNKYQQQLPPSVQWEWQAPFILCPNEPQGLGFSTLRRSFQKYAQSPFERDTCIFLPAIPQPYPRPSFYAGKRQDRNKKHVGQGKQWYGLEERPASPFLRLFCTRSTRPPCRKAASSSTTYHIHQGDDSFALVNYGNNASISTTKKGTHDTTTAEQRAEDDQRLSTLGKRRKFSFLRAHVCAVRAHTFVKK